MERPVRIRWASVVVAALLAVACGDESPTDATGGVAVDGVVMGDGMSAIAADTRATQAAQAKKMTVKVDGSATLSVDVNANGTFQLSGIPGGTFTLVFLADVAEIGRVVVTAEDGSAVKLVVQVRRNEVVVVDLRVQSPGSDPTQPSNTAGCSIEGGTLGERLELEGDVVSGGPSLFQLSVNGRSAVPVDVNASAASFKCMGGAQTTTGADCRASVQSGAKVHVSGALMTCTDTSASVTAYEVKVQKD
jgi:hypothetical protein